VTALTLYGYKLGVAGQIIDDVLDLTSNPEFLGKPVGSDLRAGVYTLPVIFALKESRDLQDVLRRGPDDETVDEAIRLILASHGVEMAQDAARTNIREATTALQNDRLREDVTAVLCAFAEEILTGACWRE